MNGEISLAVPRLSKRSDGIANSETPDDSSLEEQSRLDPARTVPVHAPQKSRMADAPGIAEAIEGASMIFVGIDPGVTGAVAFLSESSRILYATNVPTLKLTKSRRQIDGVELTRQLSALREPGIETFITIEDVHAFPGQGVTSMFSFGKSFGQVLGIIEALGLRYQLVHSTRWQNFLFKGMTGEPKHKARLAAHRLWPQNEIGKNGITDALLLAEYGRRTWVNRATEVDPQ